MFEQTANIAWGPSECQFEMEHRCYEYPTRIERHGLGINPAQCPTHARIGSRFAVLAPLGMGLHSLDTV